MKNNTLGMAAPVALANTEAANTREADTGISARATPHDPLPALCLVARLHQVSADPAALRHQLGKSPREAIGADDLLLAAKHLGLKAKPSQSSADRLSLVPLPALAYLNDGRCVVLAQCDGQRVLMQDAGAQPGTSGSRPTIEPLEVFAAQWSGALILVASRASLAGELARFDFSWFIPSLVKHRKLLGEVLLISLFLQLFALVSPLFFQVVMDKVLVHRGVTTLDVLVIGLVVVVLFESLLNALRTYVFSHTTSRIDVELGARLVPAPAGAAAGLLPGAAGRRFGGPRARDGEHPQLPDRQRAHARARRAVLGRLHRRDAALQRAADLGRADQPAALRRP